MMLISYGKQTNFGADALRKIEQANAIIADYAAQGFSLTLRQLYYQHVRRNLIVNSERSYKNLGELIGKARLNGLISWEAIEDRGRGVANQISTVDDHRDALEDVEWGIRINPWDEQPIYVEVWVEKDALSEIVEKACRPYRAPFLACKGYLSLSEAWAAGQRFRDAKDGGKNCVLIHLGDHDPSGLDMTEDNRRRLEMFGEFNSEFGEELTVRRIALNIDQVKRFSLPPNPAKMTDSRSDRYVEAYGRSSWELDALEPRFLVDLIQNELRSWILEEDVWQASLQREKDLQAELIKMRQRWPDVRNFLGSI